MDCLTEKPMQYIVIFVSDVSKSQFLKSGSEHLCVLGDRYRYSIMFILGRKNNNDTHTKFFIVFVC